MKVCLRNADEKDNQIYYKCFADKEFSNMLYADDAVNIDFYLHDKPKIHRLIVSVSIGNDERNDVGFVQLIENNGSKLTIIGGILPKYFNKGIAVFCVVAVITYIFSVNPTVTISTGILRHNVRSFRMMSAIGFRIINELSDKHILHLTSSDFDNNLFAMKVKRKIEISII